ncbi:MAG: hypothetical protein RLZZ584_925 [Pseudomonadota bacterium]|jgi:hypothetical protein
MSFYRLALAAVTLALLGACATRGPDAVDVAAQQQAPAAGMPGSGLSSAPDPARWSSAGWGEQTLPGKRLTHYQSVQFDGRACLHARAESSASMLRRKLMVDPVELGRLKFSWHVPALIADADLTRREGEDSPVRVVLAFDGNHDELDLRTRAMFDLGEMLTGERPPYATLMYVWENRQPRESLIHNPRTDRIRKIVVESGAGNLGRWLSYERDVAADYQRAFGKAPGRLIGIAVMTDSDNTASTTEAHYGELSLLSAQGRPL